MTTEQKNSDDIKKFASLKKQLRLYNKVAKENYRGIRTVVLLSGLNFNFRELEKTPYLHIYEEKFLFFLFLLRFSRTKLIYVVSQPIADSLIDYYLDKVAKSEKEKGKMLKRLIFVNLNDSRKMPVAAKLLENEGALTKISEEIKNKKTAYIQCYSSTSYEKKVAIKLDIPLYGINENLSVFGTKSGSIKTFTTCEVPCLDAITNLKTRDDLFNAIAKLAKKYPEHRGLIIKLEDYPAGEGNVIFSAQKFWEITKLGKDSALKTLSRNIADNFDKCCEQSEKLPHKKFSFYFETIENYLDVFERVGGIVELFIQANDFYSPSCQIRILPNKKVVVLSTHEQILKGKYKTEYTGCIFPASKAYRSKISKYAGKVGDYLAKKGVIGRFAVDFIAYREGAKKRYQLKAIEINLRKGGTTHPYAIARSATGALYNKKSGLLSVKNKKIYYLASDSISYQSWRGKSPKTLMDLLEKNNLDFNKDKKRGVVIHLFSMLEKEGRFGATFIGGSQKEVENIYKKTIRILKKEL
jgi:hypothetical protein